MAFPYVRSVVYPSFVGRCTVTENVRDKRFFAVQSRIEEIGEVQ